MGQPLPLPKKIPVPDDDTRKLLYEKGFVLNEWGHIHGSSGETGFITYEMPHGWKLINQTLETDDIFMRVIFEFRDENDIVQFIVSGIWSEKFNADYLRLSIEKVDGSYKLDEKRDNLSIHLDGRRHGKKHFVDTITTVIEMNRLMEPKL